jgi:Tol biopolymer transport system component
MALVPGTKLGPYEIESPLGFGGMGEVYRARDTRLERTVAIKILPAHLSSDPVRRQRFEREARTISSLNHPHICVLHDVGHQDGIDYLVMECVEGETLAKRLEKGPLPLEQALRFGAQIAEALDRAHRSGVVHRDLKPGNIILSPGGAKLLDFGLAKPTVALTSLATLSAQPQSLPITEEGTIIGTFQYMSPEQVEGKEVDPRSDIFSLGAVLYEMVTGKKAFEGKSQLSVASAILEKEPEPVSALKPTFPAALDRTLKKCLAKIPDQRWQSASDLAAQLNWIAEAGSQTGAAQVVANRQALPRLGWILSAILLLFAIVAGTAWWLGWRQPQRTMYFSSPFHAGANDLALSPDGRVVAMVAYWEQGNRYMIWIYNVGEPGAAVIEGTDGASHPFWSPDGKSLGFFAQAKLKKVELSGKSVQVLADAPNGRGGAWNKDGVILFTPDVFLGLHRVSASGGTATELTKLDESRAESSHRWPVFLPDGKHYLYLAANFSGQFDKNAIFLGSLESTEKRLIVAASSNVVYAEPGYLFYIRDNALVAHQFDMRSFSLKGDARVIRREVQYFPVVNLALFDVARNGTLVAQTGAGAADSQLSWFDRSGKLLGIVGRPTSSANPSLSPDGRHVAYDQRNPDGRAIGIWIHDLTTDAVSRLTLHPSLNQVPVWSPDGKRVAFTSNRKIFNRVFTKNSDGSGTEDELGNLTSSRLMVCWDWSRDGKYLLLRSENELWFYSLQDHKASPFVQGPSSMRNGQFSPDGKWVAYSSNETGNWEVYVSPFPVATSKWQVSRGGGEEPRWRRDGKELFYLSGEGKLMATPVTLGGSFEAMSPVVLFQTRPRQKISSQDVFTYVVSENGNKFLFNTVVDVHQAAPLSIVLNWESEMEK